ncbi:hypothetical protein [Hansschlegelia sp. KR7-227]|jgi:hypothetical protein
MVDRSRANARSLVARADCAATLRLAAVWGFGLWIAATLLAA